MVLFFYSGGFGAVNLGDSLVQGFTKYKNGKIVEIGYHDKLNSTEFGTT
jgi:hypothetical protein